MPFGSSRFVDDKAQIYSHALVEKESRNKQSTPRPCSSDRGCLLVLRTCDGGEDFVLYETGGTRQLRATLAVPARPRGRRSPAGRALPPHPPLPGQSTRPLPLALYLTGAAQLGAPLLDPSPVTGAWVQNRWGPCCRCRIDLRQRAWAARAYLASILGHRGVGPTWSRRLATGSAAPAVPAPGPRACPCCLLLFTPLPLGRPLASPALFGRLSGWSLVERERLARARACRGRRRGENLLFSLL